MNNLDLKMILACDREWGIGVNGDLLARIPADLKFFREKTLGGMIVVGRKTADSFPGGRALDGRINVMISTTEASREGFIIIRSPEELFELLENRVHEGNPISFDSNKIYVAGGGKIYSLLLPYVSTIILTKIEAILGADTFFVDLDKDPQFEMVSESAPITENNLTYKWCEYNRK